MHKDRYLKLINLLQVLMGAVLALMSFVLLPVCGPMKNGMHMACYYTGILVTVSGVVLIALGLGNYFVTKPILHKLIAFAQIAVAALSYMIPSKIIPIAIGTNMHGKTKFIGLCMKPMRCWDSFRATSICLLIVAILALIYLGMQYVTKND